jgi:hypothetical protein
MHETWLKPNRRALGFACVLPGVLAAAGLWLLADSWETKQLFWSALGAGLVVANAAIIALAIFQMRRPRIAYRDGHVLFYLRAGRPWQVPAQFVEAFFLGRGPARLPLAGGEQRDTINLVARLSQRHHEWAQRAVKPALGRWCDGYVTIFGAWCEPLGPDVIRRLNRRLKEVQAAQDGITNQ